jgi:integrase
MTGNLDKELERKGTLRQAWNLIEAWEKHTPSQSYVPLPEHIAELLALVLATEGSSGAKHAAAAVLLGFHVYARSSELKFLREKDVIPPGEANTFVHSQGVAYLRKTKSGKAQSVSLDSRKVLALVRGLRGPWDLRSEQPFFDFGKGPRGGQRTFLFWLRWAQTQVGYQDPVFVAHSLRHGGATHDYMGRYRTVLEIKLRGRWKSLEVCERYLQANEARLAGLRAPEPVNTFFAGNLKRARRLLKANWGG